MTSRCLAALGSVVALSIGCASGAAEPGAGDDTTPSGGTGGAVIVPTGTGGGLPGPGTQDLPIPNCAADCPDLPADPIFDPASSPPVTPTDVAGFGAPGTMQPAAFCLVEPQLSQGTTPGALFPANWLRPRFRWVGAPAGAIMEIRLHSDIEHNDLVAYTRQSFWLMPKDAWDKLATNARSVTVTVRALAGGAVTGVQGSFEIAPTNAGGTMVFWGTTSNVPTKTSSFLLGFRVGDEGVVSALTLSQVQWNNVLHENGYDLRGTYGGGKPGFVAGEVQCIGCHVSTPDNDAVLFNDDWPWDKVVASVKPDSVGQVPSYVTPGGRALLKQPGMGTNAMNALHWTDGDRKVVTSYNQRTKAFDGSVPAPPASEKLVWLELDTSAPISPDPGQQSVGDARNAAIAAAQGSAWDYIALTGETQPAAIFPSWSHDGNSIAYTAASKSENGGLYKEAVTPPVTADIHVVPWGGGKGGTVTPLAGASEPGMLEYYPAYSPDDKLIAFTRVGDLSLPYYNPNGEVFLVPAAGGAPVRLAGNDPVACSQEKSPGVTNSWPKWSPRVQKVGDKTYYFVIFSSTRSYPNPLVGLNAKPSQLYVSAVVVDATGTPTSYPAIYLWNQGYVDNGGTLAALQSNNLTPAWEEFVIPVVTGTVR
jgi:hypothetical protein